MRRCIGVVGCCLVFVLGCADSERVQPSEQQTSPDEQPPPEEPATPVPPVEHPQDEPPDSTPSPASCTAHDTCASDVCDRDASGGLGACVAEARVVYVDAAARPACTAGDGSRGNPVCEIRDALPLAVGERDTIRVLPGSYLNFSVSARALRFFGPGADASLVGEEDLGAGVRITNGAQVLLDGLRFGQGVRNGISCC